MNPERNPGGRDDRDGPTHDPSSRNFDPWRARRGLSTTESPSGARVIDAVGTLDAAAAAELRRETYTLLARSKAPLVIDLSAVRALDAEVAGAALLHVAHEAGDADVDLRVVRNPGADAITRAALKDESWFEVYATLDAALTDQHRRH